MHSLYFCDIIFKQKQAHEEFQKQQTTINIQQTEMKSV